MKVTICGPNLRDQSKGQLHVHAAGCGDLQAAREPEYRHGWTIDADSEKEVVINCYPPEDFDYDENSSDYHAYREDIYFFPCCDGLPGGN